MSIAIPRARILAPDANAVFAIPAIAISLFVFAYSTIYGLISLLVFYALWLALLILAPEKLTLAPLPVLFVLMLPAVAFVSALWSDVVGTTLRASLQYGTTILCGLIAARVVSVRNLAIGAVMGGLVILLYSHHVAKYGYGFLGPTYAFWVDNRPEAEHLWREFYIAARTGFHFHNTLIESFVALGLIGTVLVGAWMASLLVSSLRVAMNTGLRAEAAICAGLAIIFFIRSGVEIDFFTPYTAGSFLVPYLIVQMSDQRRAVIEAHMRTSVS